MTTTLKVSFRSIAPPSSPLTSRPQILDSWRIAKFPNTTILCPPKLRLQSSFGKKTRVSFSAAMATGYVTTLLFSVCLEFQSKFPFFYKCNPNDSENELYTKFLTSCANPTLVLFSVQSVEEGLPPALTSTSDPPAIFDGKTRLYISYTCPFAQRAWIARNCKGLEEKIELVPINLQDRPSWYKEKVYPPNKVPSLEHNNEVKGESLDLIRYIDSNFEGPSLFPDDPAKREFAEELFSYTDSFSKPVISFFKGDGTEAAAGTAFDYIETALSKFEDGPFFLGQFSLVDIAYAPFIDRFQHFALDVKKYDITAGRPKLAAWIEEMNKNVGFNKTRRDPKELVEIYKKRFSARI